MNDIEIPLCVDLDGTVVYCDMSVRSFTIFLEKNPLGIFMAGLWHLRGRGFVKYLLAQRFDFDPATLPYIQETLDFLRKEKARGRKIYLCTGSCHKVARIISNYLGLFDGIMATKVKKNFIGKVKADALIKRFGAEGFDYVGNSRQDLKVWKYSRNIYIANASWGTEEEARRNFNHKTITVLCSKK